MREADVAIRMKEPSQADLIRKKLMGIRIAPYASKSYLARSARLESIEDIQTIASSRRGRARRRWRPERASRSSSWCTSRSRF
jgi:DNA-binding transcriptional LysR family regulator